MKRFFTEAQRLSRLEASRRWRARNREHMRRLKEAAYDRAHPTPRAAADPAARVRARKAWKRRNPEKLAADKNRRRAKEAAPAWANKFFIQETYSLARLRTKITGKQWHVDH